MEINPGVYRYRSRYARRKAGYIPSVQCFPFISLRQRALAPMQPLNTVISSHVAGTLTRPVLAKKIAATDAVNRARMFFLKTRFAVGEYRGIAEDNFFLDVAIISPGRLHIADAQKAVCGIAQPFIEAAAVFIEGIETDVFLCDGAVVSF